MWGRRRGDGGLVRYPLVVPAAPTPNSAAPPQVDDDDRALLVAVAEGLADDAAGRVMDTEALRESLAQDLGNDTPAAVQAVLDDRFRSMTARERVRRAMALSEASDRFALAKLRQDHPLASPEELRLRLALRTLPPHLGRLLASRRGHPELADGHR